jgi:hypothetical protein
MYDFNETLIFSIQFQKLLKFHKNPSSGSRVDLCRQKNGRMDGATDTAKQMISFGNLAYSPKNAITYSLVLKEEEGLGLLM